LGSAARLVVPALDVGGDELARGGRDGGLFGLHVVWAGFERVLVVREDNDIVAEGAKLRDCFVILILFLRR
jgi:hypothetical protein